MAWNPCQSHATSSFDDVGVLQAKLVPFITELNRHLAWESEAAGRSRGRWHGCRHGLPHTKAASQQIDDHV